MPITPLSSSQFKYDEPEPNSKLHVQIRRKLELKCRMREEQQKICSVAKFRNLLNVAGYEILQLALYAVLTAF